MQTDSRAILDRDHLERVTLGDAALASEILSLFKAQSGDLVRVISLAESGAGAAAHKLKGSARAIGACALESAIVACEDTSAASPGGTDAIALLHRALADVMLAIEAYLAKASQLSAEHSPAAGVGKIDPL